MNTKSVNCRDERNPPLPNLYRPLHIHSHASSIISRFSWQLELSRIYIFLTKNCSEEATPIRPIKDMPWARRLLGSTSFHICINTVSMLVCIDTDPENMNSCFCDAEAGSSFGHGRYREIGIRNIWTRIEVATMRRCKILRDLHAFLNIHASYRRWLRDPRLCARFTG